MVDYQLRCGINLLDTGFQYPGHEELLGKVIPKWRDKVFIVGKWDPPLVTPTVTKATLLEALDVSLKRLNTRYIDCMMIHSIGHPRYGGIERIQNPAIYEAWDEAKQLGKIRFTGASSHGVRMIEEIGWGLDNDRFDVILIGANFLTHGVEPLLKKARAKGVATIAMKTMTIYKSDLNIRALQNQQRERAAGGAQVGARLGSVRHADRQHAQLRPGRRVPRGLGHDEPLGRGSGPSRPAGARDRPRCYCRPGCDGCAAACPRGVPVADILRYRMYFENYGEEKFAMSRYALVPAAARAVALPRLRRPVRGRLPVRPARPDAAPRSRSPAPFRLRPTMKPTRRLLVAIPTLGALPRSSRSSPPAGGCRPAPPTRCSPARSRRTAGDRLTSWKTYALRGHVEMQDGITVQRRLHGAREGARPAPRRAGHDRRPRPHLLRVLPQRHGRRGAGAI